jgi:hypothetical protein
VLSLGLDRDGDCQNAKLAAGTSCDGFLAVAVVMTLATVVLPVAIVIAVVITLVPVTVAVVIAVVMTLVPVTVGRARPKVQKQLFSRNSPKLNLFQAWY